MQVIKKDNSIELWDESKIIDAIKKASNRCCSYISTTSCKEVADLVEKSFTFNIISTREIHSRVISALFLKKFDNIAKAYQEYRDYKNSYAKSWEEIKKESDDILYLGDKENANFDSSLISTKRSLIQGALTKELYKQFYLTKEENALIKRGDIYIHDLRDMLLGSINCCLFDIGNVLKDGFEMSNIRYTEPKSVLSALQVIGDITLVASAQQFGGFTLPEIDKVLLPYCKKTYKTAFDFIIKEFNQSKDKAKSYAFNVLKRELEQGFQSLELKLNTVPSSRGDFAFTTLTFGQWDVTLDPEDKKMLALICNTLLKVRMKGHEDKPVVFPKLVYLYDQFLIKADKYAQEVFDKCVKCSANNMYPDYLSLTGSPKVNAVAKEYLTTGKIISPMGCRAYLSHWTDPETNESITIGRCNIGAVSLHLPLILAIAQKEYPNSWQQSFYILLENTLNTIRNFFKRRYETISKTKVSTNPLAFTQGGFYKGNKDINDTIGDLVKYMTASFGITALNEFCLLWNNKPISEDNTEAIRVVQFITNKVNEFKKEDGYLYALYGTPAESLASTQAKQLNKYLGENKFGTFLTNSFHCHVSEDITPIEKQDKEYELFHMINGGHIQYVRLDNPENEDAVKAFILRGMDKGFYQGVNFDSAYCQDCHCHSTNVLNVCPKCGSKNITVISRVCGYLGYSNINGHTRMNNGKLDEINARKSM